jgi:fatty acid desaturase
MATPIMMEPKSVDTIKLDLLDLEDRDESIGGIVLAREGLKGAVRELSQVNDLRFLGAVARQWLVITLAISVAVLSNHWAVYLLMMIVIATRQHALGILMHDGTHFRCLSNRTANDVVCNLFCALPIGILTSRYRYEHQLHHRFLNTDQDPYWMDFKLDSDWHWPKTRKKALWIFIRDLLGLNGHRNWRVIYRWSPWSNHFSRRKTPPPLTPVERATIYGFFASVLIFLTLTNGWLEFLWLWLVPLSTITVALMRLRTIAEHLGLPNKDELDASRHIEGSLLERLSISPLNINYHIDHHLFPAVPYYNLPKLHELLLKNEHYRRHAHINQTYLGIKNGLIGEIIK